MRIIRFSSRLEMESLKAPCSRAVPRLRLEPWSRSWISCLSWSRLSGLTFFGPGFCTATFPSKAADSSASASNSLIPADGQDCCWTKNTSFSDRRSCSPPAQCVHFFFARSMPGFNFKSVSTSFSAILCFSSSLSR